MAKAPEPGIPGYPIWATILIMTFLIVLLLAIFFFVPPFWNSGRAFIALLLMLSFSIALTAALTGRKMKLLYYTGLLEFIVLALPMLTLQTSPSYVPYSITPPFIFSFPVLWLLLPVVLMRMTKDKARRKAFLYILLLISASVAISSLLACSIGGNIQPACNLIFSPVWIVPLLVWYLSYRQINAPPKKPGKGIWVKLGVEPSVFALITAFICIMALGFLMMINPQQAHPRDVCGDGFCSGSEDCYTCGADCGQCARCGNGICDYGEEGSCMSDCGGSVKVTVSGGVACSSISVKLKGYSGELISVRTSSLRAVTFKEILAEGVYAEVSSPESVKEPVRSSTINLKVKDTIRIALPDDYCEPPQPLQPLPTGTVHMSLKDFETGQPVEGVDVRILRRSDSSVYESTKANGEWDVLLPADEWYYAAAEKEGYEAYLGEGNEFYVIGGDNSFITISLTPAA